MRCYFAYDEYYPDMAKIGKLTLQNKSIIKQIK